MSCNLCNLFFSPQAKRKGKSGSPKLVDVKKRSKDDTTDECRIKIKAKVTATKKKSSPNKTGTTKSSPSKNGPLIQERRLTRRMTASILKPNSNENIETQSNSTDPMGNKGSQADTETVERADKMNNEPSSKKRKMESENMDELPMKRKSESDMTDELFGGVAIKKEMLDEQFPNYLETTIKKEIEDTEGDVLNESFRVVGSLQFDMSDNPILSQNDDGPVIE